MYQRKIVALVLAAVGWGGCATVDPKPSYERVAREIESATGVNITVDPEGGDKARQRAEAFLSDGLTDEEAVLLCLMNNPRLQAGFLQIGVSHAEWVQSGLFSNPSLALSLRIPDEGGLANFQVSLAQNIAELWQIKHRRRAAEQDLDQVVLKMAREASVTALKARGAYLASVQADRIVALANENLEIGGQLVELALARKQAGSGTEVDVNLARSEHVSLEVKARKAVVSSVTARTEFAKILGLTIPPHELVLADPLPDPQTMPFDVTRIVEATREHRVDLKAADAVIEAARSRVALERARFLRTVELGIDVERGDRRSRGGRNFLAESAFATVQSGAPTLPSLQPREPQTTDSLTGPTLSLELPLFDQNQSQIARAEFELLAAKYLRESIERDIVQDSWAAYSQARGASENAEFIRDELVPLREKGLALAREAFRAGNTTLLAVLEAQRTLLEAKTNYVQAQADAAAARIELERVSGLPFSSLVTSTKSNQETNPESKP